MPVGLLLIAVPFIYMSIQVNKYAVIHKPEGFPFPHITDFWMSLVGALVSQLAKGVAIKMLLPIFEKIVKVSDDELYKKQHSRKGAEYCYTTIMYLVVSIWGYYVLKDSKHLPWFMGGKREPIEAF